MLVNISLLDYDLRRIDVFRYQDQMADYQPPEDDGNEEDTGKQKKKRQKKDKDAPKGTLHMRCVK